jgi:nicotinate-nucleotide pyrophosphorylase (carboxylating)
VPINYLDEERVDIIVRNAILEDLATLDVTTPATVPFTLQGRAKFLAKQDGVLAGMQFAFYAFKMLEPRAKLNALVEDGQAFSKGTIVAEVSASVRTLLMAERVALNFLQRLCATATLTRKFVEAVDGTGAVILDTRKTTPGLRDMEKYAVRCGGGTNHRRDLSTMAMIKDNHREALEKSERSLADGVAEIRRRSPDVQVEIEVDSLNQLEDALAGNPEWILLDNMAVPDMREAVRIVGGRAKLEASGGVTLETVRAIAETGVDAISVGALTHSAGALDISLDLEF